MAVAQDILGDPQGAAEVTTDTFHALWHHLDQLEDPNGFGAWALETSRSFAQERLPAPGDDKERHPPVPLFFNPAALSTMVSNALASRGVPAAAGHAAGAPTALLSQVPAGAAGNSARAGFSGSAGSNTILGGSVAGAAEAADVFQTVAKGVTLDQTESVQRAHRYELPEPSHWGEVLRSTRLVAAALAAAVVVLAGAVLWLSHRNDDGKIAVSDQSVAAPSTAPTTTLAGGAAAGAVSSDTTDTSPSSTETSTTDATTVNATTTILAPVTTRSTVGSTTRSTSTRPSSTVTATTVTTEPTTPTSKPTTTATTAGSSSTKQTATTLDSTTVSRTTGSTVAKPTIDQLAVTLGLARCASGGSSYVVSWVTTNASTVTGSVLVKLPLSFSGKGRGSFSFCAPSSTVVTLTATGPGGTATARTTTP